jgi:hypothetical protein
VAEWHDAQAMQEGSEKKIAIYDARKVAGLTHDQQEQLTRELSRPGPTPQWIRDILKR